MKTTFLGSLPSDGRFNLPAGGAGGVDQPLEVQPGDDVGVLSVAVFAVGFGPVELVKPGGHDDGPVGVGYYLVFIFVVDGPGGAELFADLAFAGL